ncbi:hypothetical protein AMTR_s00149p00077920 [Amborella trichopoda]|uniref:Uncharacterized protein n=1 Tax=Amborella trichopoda TaxID=13333 RepID=W1PML9_AMBTC|nr:hypothetical protein AMTR_s00149p00077920 [Amborella trichopoda]
MYWKPSQLEQISEEMVDHYFTMVDEEGWTDLEFPQRKNSKCILSLLNQDFEGLGMMLPPYACIEEEI